MIGDPSLARAPLFVPGDRPDRFDKALGSGADAVIVDLEDAVAPAAKEGARAAVAAWLDGGGRGVLLRINEAGSPWHVDDMLLAANPGISGIVLPKATAEAMHAVDSADGAVWALVETARGLLESPRIAAHPAVTRLVLGLVDLGLDLGAEIDAPGGHPLADRARCDLVIASASAGLPSPVDGAYPALDDAAGLAAAAAHGRRTGMGGMLCLHPAQVAVVRRAHAPSPSQMDFSRRLLDASEGQAGAFRFEGRMIDAPILDRARRISGAG